MNMYDFEPPDYLMTQCLLTQGSTQTTAYIPSVFANQGALIAIQGKQWTVAETYQSSEKPYNELNSGEHKFIKDNWSNI